MEHDNNTHAAIEAGKQLASQTLHYVNGCPVAILANGMHADAMPGLREIPGRIEQNVTTNDVDSFLAYFNRFSREDSVIFCEAEQARFVGVLDYHGPDAPQWGNHRVHFTMRRTDEWLTWRENDGAKFDQAGFARFIQDNLDEIVSPTGAEMLEIATSLRAKTKVNFSSATRLDNGQVQFAYAEVIDGTAGAQGQLAIPETIEIGLRLYEGGEGYKMQARFRYRIREGKLVVWYDLVRPRKVQQAAVADTLAAINEKANAALVINGAP